MITRLCYKFSFLTKLLTDQQIPKELQKIRDFNSFLKNIEQASKLSQLNKVENYLDEYKEFDSVTCNLETLEWFYSQTEDSDIINSKLNNLLGNQVNLVQKALQQNLVSRAFLNDFSLNFENLHIIMQMNNYYIGIMLQYLSTVQNKFGQLDDIEEKALLQVCDAYKYIIPCLYPNYISTQLFYISNLNLSSYSMKLYFEVFVSLTKRISKMISSQNDFQLKSIYYSLGKNGFYDKGIKKFVLQEIGKNVNIINETQFQCQINLILCATNLFFKEININKVKQKIKFILQHQSNYIEKSNYQLCTLFCQILRCQIFDEEIWESIFATETLLAESYQKSQLLNNIIVQKEKFVEKHQQYIIKELEPRKDELMRKIRESREKYTEKQFHSFESRIEQQFEQLGLKYEKNKMFDQYELDFYFPKYNLIVEICGPSHYSYFVGAKKGTQIRILNKDICLQQDLNLVTANKKTELEKLGFNVLYINYQELRKINIQSLLLKHLLK